MIREYRSNYPLDSMFYLFERDTVNYMDGVPKRPILDFASLEGNYRLALQSLLNRTNSQKQNESVIFLEGVWMNILQNNVLLRNI